MCRMRAWTLVLQGVMFISEKCHPQEKASLPTLELPTKVNLFQALTIQPTYEISTPTC